MAIITIEIKSVCDNSSNTFYKGHYMCDINNSIFSKLITEKQLKKFNNISKKNIKLRVDEKIIEKARL